MGHNNIYIEKFPNELCTIGLKKIIGKEIRLTKLSKSDHAYEEVLNFIIDYVNKERPNVEDGHTIAYYSWLLKFEKSDNLYFNLFEADKNGNGFVEGVDYSILVKEEQVSKCREFDVNPIFPSFGQKIAISKGVYDGLPIQAVRYPSPSHMSGWYLTTDLYDGNIDSLEVVHFYHVPFKRPELLKFLALPYGYRFYLDIAANEVLFDPTVLEESN